MVEGLNQNVCAILARPQEHEKYVQIAKLVHIVIVLVKSFIGKMFTNLSANN